MATKKRTKYKPTSLKLLKRWKKEFGFDFDFDTEDGYVTR